jgi:hypothetical protein
VGDEEFAKADGRLAMFFSQTHLIARIGSLIVLLLGVASASGQSTNLLKNPNGDEGLQPWLVSGNGSITDCVGLGKCFSIWQDGFIYQDVGIPENAAGTFAVFIGFASIEEPTQDAHLLGHPYLYGYFMTAGELSKATVLSRPNGQQMANHPSANGEWVKQYGVFKVPDKTGRIRIFLRSGCSKTASLVSCASHFRAPGIFLFSNEDEARAFVNTYQ